MSLVGVAVSAQADLPVCSAVHVVPHAAWPLPPGGATEVVDVGRSGEDTVTPSEARFVQLQEAAHLGGSHHEVLVISGHPRDARAVDVGDPGNRGTRPSLVLGLDRHTDGVIPLEHHDVQAIEAVAVLHEDRSSSNDDE